MDNFTINKREEIVVDLDTVDKVIIEFEVSKNGKHSIVFIEILFKDKPSEDNLILAYGYSLPNHYDFNYEIEYDPEGLRIVKELKKAMENKI